MCALNILQTARPSVFFIPGSPVNKNWGPVGEGGELKLAIFLKFPVWHFLFFIGQRIRWNHPACSIMKRLMFLSIGLNMFSDMLVKKNCNFPVLVLFETRGCAVSKKYGTGRCYRCRTARAVKVKNRGLSNLPTF